VTNGDGCSASCEREQVEEQDPVQEEVPAEEVCTNGLDDDGNGNIDCLDSACEAVVSCQLSAAPS
jgi:hypothetical protein